MPQTVRLFSWIVADRLLLMALLHSGAGNMGVSISSIDNTGRLNFSISLGRHSTISKGLEHGLIRSGGDCRGASGGGNGVLASSHIGSSSLLSPHCAAVSIPCLCSLFSIIIVVVVYRIVSVAIDDGFFSSGMFVSRPNMSASLLDF